MIMRVRRLKGGVLRYKEESASEKNPPYRARLSMSTPSVTALPPEDEAQRLRARIAELEIEIGHFRGSTEARERKNAEALAPESELQYKEVFANVSICMFL